MVKSEPMYNNKKEILEMIGNFPVLQTALISYIHGRTASITTRSDFKFNIMDLINDQLYIIVVRQKSD